LGGLPDLLLLKKFMGMVRNGKNAMLDGIGRRRDVRHKLPERGVGGSSSRDGDGGLLS
jgi:hypothetical protein